MRRYSVPTRTADLNLLACKRLVNLESSCKMAKDGDRPRKHVELPQLVMDVHRFSILLDMGCPSTQVLSDYSRLPRRFVCLALT